MRIRISNVEPIVKEAKYTHFTVNYTSDGRPSKKKIVSFGTGEVAYKALRDAQPGQEFDIESVKDDNGHWQWKALTPVAAGAPAAGGGGGRFESPDRQKSIVRQSSLAQALAFYARPAYNNPVDPAEVMQLAEEFEEWVNRE